MQKCLGSTITDIVGRKSLKSIFPIILFFQPYSFPLHCVQVVETMSSFCLSFSLISVSSPHLFIKIYTLYTSIQFPLTSPKYTVQAYRARVTLLCLFCSLSLDWFHVVCWVQTNLSIVQASFAPALLILILHFG